METDEVTVPEDNESTENTLFQICTQVFAEPGIQISILSEEDIVLKDAVIRIIPVESIEPESIEEAVQWMAETALEEKIREADGVSLSIYNMYADLEVSGTKQVKAKAIDFAGLSVTKVGEWHFYGDTFLVEMDLTDTKVTNIGEYAFYECSSLEKNFLPDSVTEIGEYAFSDCEVLLEIDLLKTKVKSIGGSCIL